ncbi:unnamed protein product [Leuciscus chuanchicus]
MVLKKKLGNSVTLSCNYSGVVYNLLWYRQYQRSKPELLLSITESGVTVKADPSAHWFSAEVDKQRKLIELEISPAKVTDSAQFRTFPHYKDYTSTVDNLQWYRQYPRSKPEFLLYILPRGDMENADANTINPLISEKQVTAGDNVTLSCQYSSVYISQWYRQYPGSRLEYLIFATELSGQSEPALRLSSVAERGYKRMHLSIFSAEMEDSALYYCALVPTVTVNTPTLYKDFTDTVDNLQWYRQYPRSKPEFLLYIFPGGDMNNVLANAITSQSTEKHALEGEKTTLSCNYSGTTINSFQWYRQSSNTAPEFLLQVFESLGQQQKDRDSLGDLITSHGPEKEAQDGNSVTLSCNYSGAVLNLLWYRQYQRSKPELLLSITESGDPVKADPSAHWSDFALRLILVCSKKRVFFSFLVLKYTQSSRLIILIKSCHRVELQT